MPDYDDSVFDAILWDDGDGLAFPGPIAGPTRPTLKLEVEEYPILKLAVGEYYE